MLNSPASREDILFVQLGIDAIQKRIDMCQPHSWICLRERLHM